MGTGIARRGWPPHNKGTLVSTTTAQTGSWYAITVLNAGPPTTPKIVTNAVAQTGTWFAITMLSGTFFATLTEIGASLGGTIASALFPAGVVIYGSFTNFTLTSGSVRAHGNRVPFATVTDIALTAAGSYASMPIADGATIFGAFTNFTLNNGAAVLAYDDKAVTSGNST